MADGKKRRFPIDCPRDCEYHIAYDLSVDDWTHICTKLNLQMDEMDYGIIFMSCPLEE